MVAAVLVAAVLGAAVLGGAAVLAAAAVGFAVVCVGVATPAMAAASATRAALPASPVAVGLAVAAADLIAGITAEAGWEVALVEVPMCLVVAAPASVAAEALPDWMAAWVVSCWGDECGGWGRMGVVNSGL